MDLALHGTPLSHLGYGTFVANLKKGLDAIGADYWLTPSLAEYARVFPKADAAVWATLPSHAPGGWAGQWTAAYTMFETTRLPESFRDRFRWFDRIMVPCEQNVELFAPYHRDVVKVPLGYDADVWVPAERQVGDTFRVLCAGAGLAVEGGRKGFDLAVQAFAAAFPDWETMDPSPRLVTKSIRQTQQAAPFVEAHVGQTSVERLVEIVHSCHAYLGPSRGEGWGYWPQQAVATGIPAVISAIPAHMEYADVAGIMTVPVRQKKADYFAFGNAGEWWEADFDLLVDGLRAVYADWTTWYEAAQSGAPVMADRFSHVRMAENMLAHVEWGSASDEWVEFTPDLFPLQVRRRVSADIGETHYEMVPGQTYQVKADVVRVLTESGAAL